KLAVSAPPTPTVSHGLIGRPVRWNMRASSAHATTLAATTSSWKTHAGPPVVAPPKTGISTIELATRFQAGEMDPAPETLTRATSVSVTSHLSESARAALKLGHLAI